MKRKLVVVFTSFVLLFVGFIGCTSTKKASSSKEAININKNTIVLTDKDGNKHECFLLWFLHHLDQFSTKRITEEKLEKE